MDIILQILGVLLCLCLSAFFSGSETALFSLSKSKLNLIVDEEKPSGRLLLEHLSSSPNLLITILIGNMFVNIFSTSIFERLSSSLFNEYGLHFAIGTMMVIIILFGEITPKLIAVNHSRKISLFVIPYIDFMHKLLTPVRRVLYEMSCLVVSNISKIIDLESDSSYSEVSSMMLDGRKAGVLYRHEREMIEGVIKLQTLRVKEIMTPRTEMVFFEINESKKRIFKAMRKGQFSRIPIFENERDNIIGILYIKDFLFIREKPETIRSILRKPFFVPETKLAVELFKEMRHENTHIAIVVDEYGGVEGIITMEDILEEIFGDILDKKDALLTLKKISPNRMKVSGRLTIDDFNEVFKTAIIDEINITIGGYLLTKFGHIPKKGESITIDNLEFVVSLAKKNRIEEIVVNKLRKKVL